MLSGSRCWWGTCHIGTTAYGSVSKIFSETIWDIGIPSFFTSTLRLKHVSSSSPQGHSICVPVTDKLSCGSSGKDQRVPSLMWHRKPGDISWEVRDTWLFKVLKGLIQKAFVVNIVKNWCIDILAVKLRSQQLSPRQITSQLSAFSCFCADSEMYRHWSTAPYCLVMLLEALKAKNQWNLLDLAMYHLVLGVVSARCMS